MKGNGWVEKGWKVEWNEKGLEITKIEEELARIKLKK